MAERACIDEAMENLFERVKYAVQLADEAYHTPDGEDCKVDPIHTYAAGVIRDTVPLAVLGLFVLAWQSRAQSTDSRQSERGE